MTDHFVRSDVQKLLDLIAAGGRPPISEFSPQQAREISRQTREITEAPLGDIRRVADFACPGPGGDIALRLFDDRAGEERTESADVIVYYHGGGFVIGSIDSHTPLCAELARRTRRPVVSIEYRLAPEHPFPAAPDDALAAARWIARNGAALGIAVGGLIPVGDSAGANLAYVTAAALRDAPEAAPVRAVGLLYPVTEECGSEGSFHHFAEGFILTRDLIRWFDGHYRPHGDDPRRNFARAGYAGMAPVAIMTASLDPLLDQGRALAGRLAEHGIDCVYLEAKGTLHGFATMRKLVPSAQQDVDRFLDHLMLLAEAGR